MTSTHGFADVFGVCEDIGAVSSQSHSYGEGENSGTDEQVTPSLFPEMIDKLHYPHQCHQHEVVVEHLRVFGGSCCNKNHRKNRSKKVFFLAEYQVETS